MSDQKLLSKDELLSLLKSDDIAIAPRKTKVLDGDVPAFLRFFNVKPGEDYINPLVIYFLYKNWSSKKLTFVKFKVIIGRYLNNSQKGFFYNSLEAKFTSQDLYDATKKHFQEKRKEIEAQEKKPSKHKRPS
jgi:hypothetical protein